uniref:Protein kinase domain-containing protein n=1 Tax=Helobdella robusta TaxID=6412 RepID=T1G2G9_HELRO
MTDKYLIGNEIGIGNFSIVKECKDKKRGIVMALKIIDQNKIERNHERLMKEINIMKRLKHENILRLINKFETQEHIYLVLEYSQVGNLGEFLVNTEYYNEQDISGMLHNIATGLHYIHSNKIIHRDIKFENVLIHEDSSGSKLKICDFGLACEFSDRLTVICGTPHFIAPEMLSQHGYDCKVDIWSLGVMFYILLFGMAPFSCSSNDFNDIFERIMKNEIATPSENWSHVSPEAISLLECTFQRDVDKRYTASEILNFPWISVCYYILLEFNNLF